MKLILAQKTTFLAIFLLAGMVAGHAQTAPPLDYSRMGLLELSSRASKGDQDAADTLEKRLGESKLQGNKPKGAGSSITVLGTSRGLGLTPKKWRKISPDQAVTATDNIGQTKAPALLKAAKNSKIKYRQLDRDGLVSLAQSGDPNAQFELARRLEYGNPGIKQDVRNAFLWEMQAAKSGHAQAQYGVSLKYTFGKGVAASDKTALYWMRKSAENGYFAAQYSLFETYLAGIGVDKNPVEAALWATRAYAQKDNLSEEMRKELQRVYKFDQPKSKPPRTMAPGKLTNLAAPPGKPERDGSLAERKLAEISREFVIVSAKIKARIAKIEAGDKSAAGRKETNRLHERVRQLNEAAKFWGAMKTMEQTKKQFAVAKQNIKNGSKTVSSLKFVWTMKPVELMAQANNGDRDAQKELALRYKSGKNGFEKNLAAAFKWMLKAASKGDAGAQYFIASNYFDGKGVEKSNMRAAYWLLKSAENGNKFAQFQLHKEFEGRTYFVWGIFEKNPERAEYWLKKAVAQGFEAAVSHKSQGHPEF